MSGEMEHTSRGRHTTRASSHVNEDVQLQQDSFDSLNNVMDLDQNMTDAGNYLEREGHAKNTKKSYDPKEAEFKAYCIHRATNSQQFPFHIDADKVFRFIVYQCAREKKTKGTKKKGTSSSPFDLEDYRSVMSRFTTESNFDPESSNFTPNKGLGWQCIGQYKAVIMAMHQAQVEKNQNSQHWDHIWTIRVKKWQKYVKKRRVEQQREGFHEKAANDEFAPYLMVAQRGNVEQELWNKGVNCSSMLATANSLRSRAIFNYTTGGILRYESLQRAELSDWQYVTAQKYDDPHPIEMQVTEIPKGKTNQDSLWLYGRAARHKDVRLCSVGGNAFYLALRFHVTREWDNWENSDWLDNEKWYRIKYLTNMENRVDRDLKSELSSNTYSNAIKDALSSLGLPTNKLLHLGRKIGPKILELINIQSEDIRRLGNWDPRIQEKCYSTCLPMAAIRGAAGYESNNGMYWNPRAQVEVKNRSLREATPFGPLETAYEFITARNRNPAFADNEKAITAERFLKCMTCFNTAFLQDAAAMLILHPERKDHAVFKLACFRMPEFEVR